MLLTSVIIYLLITVAIGYLASRLVKNSSDFVLAGRSLPLFLSAAALFATWFGSETVLGASSEFAEHGLLGIIEDPFGASLCLLLYGFFFARPLYRMNLLTLGDLFRNRFGKVSEFLAAIFLIPSYFSWIAAQLVALGILLESISGLDFTYGVLISTMLVTFYTAIGGMWAVSITDFIQSVIIVIGLFILAATMAYDAGGIAPVLEQTPEGFFNFFPQPEPVAILTYIAAWITLGLGSLPSQDIFQRAMSSKSETVARNSSILAALIYLVVSILPLFIALSAKVLYPEILGDDSQSTLPDIVIQRSNLFIQIVFFGSLLSAILSTTSAAILAPASVLSENLIRPHFNKHLKDQHFLVILRISVVLIAGISCYMALKRSSIYELVGLSSALTLVSLFIPMVAAIYIKRSGKFSAIFSMSSGMLAWLVFQVVEIKIPIILPSLGIALVAFLVGLLIDIRKNT